MNDLHKAKKKASYSYAVSFQLSLIITSIIATGSLPYLVENYNFYLRTVESYWQIRDIYI